MNYTIREFEEDSVVVDFADGSWAKVLIADGMSTEEIDKRVSAYEPKTDVSITDANILSLKGSTRSTVSITEDPAPDTGLTPEQIDAVELEKMRMFKEAVDEILKEYSLIA